MTVKEMMDKLGQMNPEANIITYNRTSHRWFKTGNAANYPVMTIKDTLPNCGEYAKKQLEAFDESDVTFFF